MTGPRATEYFDRRIEDMKAERSSWIAHWRDLQAHFSPRRGRFLYTDRNKGNRRNTLANNTPVLAKRTLAAGMMSGMTSPSKPWFRLMTPDPDLREHGPVQAWLDAVERVIYRVLRKSGFYRAMPSVYEELGVFGTGAMLMEPNFRTGLKFTPYTVGEYMLDIDGGNVLNAFGREYELTVGQTVRQFGRENVTETVRNLERNNALQTAVPVRHIIEPTDRGTFTSNMNLVGGREDRYRSVYYEGGRAEADKVLRVQMYPWFPILGARWDVRPGDVYGYSPGMDALGDARALQVQEKEKAKAVALQNRPPVKAPRNMDKEDIALVPGAVNFTDDPHNAFTSIYQVNARPDLLALDIQKTERRINAALYVDLFLMIAQQDDVRTATEIAARQEEKLLQLGPVLESVHNDVLDPLIENTFDVLVEASRDGWAGEGPMLLPPPPEALGETDLDVEYTSLLAQAQRLVESQSLERFSGFVGQLSGIWEEARDKVSVDDVVDEMAKTLGVPQKAINDGNAVANIRQGRADAAAQAQQLAVTAQGVEAAKTLSETPTTGDNALAAILGGG